MALKGTLKDFSMADIFQLISLQRKSGVLKVSRAGEEITISFLNGNIVWADTSQRELEEKLGQVLLKNGKISAHQLDCALELQKNTLQRLGHILITEGLIKQDDLKEALSRQAKLIAYRIFRWNDGEYDFDQEADLEYDRDNFVPLSAESIMMECARMSDEWEIIERRIKATDVFAKVHRNDEIAVEEVQSIIDEDIDFGFGEEGKAKDSSRIMLSPDVSMIYNLIDGKTPSADIVRKSDLGDFETLRIILELWNRNLVQKVKTGDEREEYRLPIKIEVTKLRKTTLAIIISVLAALAIYLFPVIFPGTFIVRSFHRYTNDVMLYLSKAQIEKIDAALTVHYFTFGRFPVRLEELIVAGLVKDTDLIDPWGNNYLYALYDDAYRLQGLNGEGKEDSELTIINNFSNLQKIIIQSSIAEGKNGTFNFASELP